MSYSIEIAGRDKEKLKEWVRQQQSKDEVNADGTKNPYPSGIPTFVTDRLCSEIDRARIYTYQDRVYGLIVKAQGHHSEQGGNDSLDVRVIQLDQ